MKRFGSEISSHPTLISPQPSNPRHTVKSPIKAQDSPDAVDLHDREMHRITRRKLLVPEHDLLGLFHCGPVHGKNLIDHAQQCVKRRLNRIRPRDRNVAMQDFLQHFRISYQPLSATHQFLQPAPGIAFVRMSSANQIHWDVGINKDHEGIPNP